MPVKYAISLIISIAYFFRFHSNQKPFIAAVLCGLLVMSGANQEAKAANYFNWGVESNSTSSGPVYSYNDGTTRDCTVSHSGSCSMRLNVIGNDNGNQGMGADINQTTMPFNVVGGPAIYYRWYMKIMPGFSWGSGTAKTKSSRVLGASFPRVYTGYVQSDGFNIGECDDVGSSQPGGGCVDPGPSISYNMRAKNDGVWHEYIAMVKPNTTTSATDAQFKVWIDGALVGQVLNFRLHNKSGNGFIEAWGSWMVSPYFQLNGTSSDGGTIYVDDFSTDDTFNSLIGGNVYPPPNLRAQ
jgi:hypothetical protein